MQSVEEFEIFVVNLSDDDVFLTEVLFDALDRVAVDLHLCDAF